MQQFSTSSAASDPKPDRIPEARYAYYRRCQVFRKGGEQCKAPAEKGSRICYAHAGQLATAVRRERERRAVLAEAVAEMRKRGRPECEMADLFMDFKAINLTLAVMAQALIDGRIDCKTAGRLVVQLQTASKLLWMIQRKRREERKESRVSSQICADEQRLDVANRAGLRLVQGPSIAAMACGERGVDSRVAFDVKLTVFPGYRQGCRDGPWQQTRAA